MFSNHHQSKWPKGHSYHSTGWLCLDIKLHQAKSCKQNCFAQTQFTMQTKLVVDKSEISILPSRKDYKVHGQIIRRHTIAFVEDVLGRLAQISVWRRHSHCTCRGRQNIIFRRCSGISLFWPCNVDLYRSTQKMKHTGKKKSIPILPWLYNDGCGCKLKANPATVSLSLLHSCRFGKWVSLGGKLSEYVSAFAWLSNMNQYLDRIGMPFLWGAAGLQSNTHVHLL